MHTIFRTKPTLTTIVLILFMGVIFAQIQHQTAFAQTSETDSLIGAWLGPTPGDVGRCGASSGMFVFRQDGSYAFQSLSQRCGDYTLIGMYQVQNDTIDFQQTGGSPGTQCCDALSVRYRFANLNTLRIEDQPGHWLIYFRQ